MKFLSHLTYALSCKRVAAPAPGEDLTVVSYNIRYFNNTPLHRAAVRLDFLRQDAEQGGLSLLVPHQGNLLD